MVGFDTLQELSVGEENCYQLSHVSLDFRHLLGFLLHPAGALFEQKDPCNSRSFLSHRLSPTRLCLPWVNSARENGEGTRVFLLHFPAGNLHCCWKPSQAQRPPLRSCTKAWWPLSLEGEVRLVAKAGISGSWVCVTWVIKLNSSAFPRLSHWDWQLGVYECESCAVVIHTYCICYMEVENIKLGCFDLLNTLLLNLKQHSAISSDFFLPKMWKMCLNQ